MALEMRAAPRPVSARQPPRTAARDPWAMVAADRLLAAYWTRRRAATRPRSQLRSGRRMADLVPHTGFPVNRLMRLSRGHPVLPGDA
jgi:hypothetical protein